MAKSGSKGARRVLRMLFPAAPDFLGLLVQHCDVLVDAQNALLQQISGEASSGDASLEAVIRHGAEVRRRNLDVLNRSFVTPIDREDIYLATERLAEVLAYIESTEREMELLDVRPDTHIRRMAQVLGDGIVALQDGFKKLGQTLLDAEADAQRAMDSERRMEDLYRAALADLFRGEAIQALRHGKDPLTASDCLDHVVSMLKKREVYRHLSNAADRVALAGETLHDIVVKWT